MAYLIQYWLFRSFAFLLQSMTLHCVRITARSLGLLAACCFPFRRSVIIEQLQRAFPEKGRREISSIARQSYVNLVTTVCELIWTPCLTRETMDREMRLVNVEAVLRARERGHGIVFVTGHYGNWEWIPHPLTASLGIRILAIVHPLHNVRVDAAVESYRRTHGIRLVDMKHAAREALNALHGGDAMLIVADQSAPRESIFVRFLGRPAATFKGPAMFALKTGAALIAVFSLRRADGGYDLLFREVPAGDLTGASDRNIGELTRRHVKVLESMVRERPGEWLWHHRRWKTAPDEASRIIEDPMA